MSDPWLEPPEGMAFVNYEKGIVAWAEPSERLPSLVAEIHIGKGLCCEWPKQKQIEAYKGIINACKQAILKLEEEDESQD